MVEQDDPLEEESEEEGEKEDSPSSDQPIATSDAQEHPSPPTAQETPAPTPVQVPDRYEIGKCTVHISITMLEGSDQPQGRSVLLGVRNDADVPLISMVRLADLEPLPAPIAALLAQLETELPQRRQAMQEQLTKTQREQAAKAAATKQQAKPRAQAPASTSAQAPAATSSDQPAEKAAGVEPKETPATPPQPQQKQAPASKRNAKEEDSPFEQMTFF